MSVTRVKVEPCDVGIVKSEGGPIGWGVEAGNVYADYSAYTGELVEEVLTIIKCNTSQIGNTILKFETSGASTKDEFGENNVVELNIASLNSEISSSAHYNQVPPFTTLKKELIRKESGIFETQIGPFMHGLVLNCRKSGVYDTFCGYKNISIEYNKYVPEISNFNVTCENVFSNAVCTWETADATNVVLQVLKDDVVIQQVDVTGLNTYTLPPRFTSHGSHTFKIIGTSVTGDITESSKNINIADVVPIISTQSISSDNVEKGTTITTTVAGSYHDYTVNILNSEDQIIVANVGHNIPTLQLGAGSYKAQIDAYYTNGYYTSHAYKVIPFTVFMYNATVTSLWPISTRETRKSSIEVGFSAKNFDTATITVSQNGVSKYSNTVSNTSDPEEIKSKTFNLVNSLLDVGTATINVSISNTRNGYTTTDSMAGTFSVIDNPNAPVISSEATYSNPKPTVYISCSSEYVSYKVAIDGEEKTELFGNITQYTFTESLSNNEHHTFKVKVKNTYGLWSEWGTSTFLVSYAELETPLISVYRDVAKGIICVAMESQEQANFVDHSVLREENGVWVEIGKELERIATFNDNLCASLTNYKYKVRANDIYGGYKDSSIVECSIELAGTFLTIPWTNEVLKLCYYSSQEDSHKPVSLQAENEYVEVCGLDLPKLKKGNIKSRNISLNLTFKTSKDYNEFIRFSEEDVVLLRDAKGLKMYCHIDIKSYSGTVGYFRTISASFQEVYYKEGDFAEVKDVPCVWETEEF